MAPAWHDRAVPILLLLLLLAVVASIALVAAGRGGSLADVVPDRSPRGVLPEGPVDRAAVDGLRFTLAVRGYRMDEVDSALDRLVGELESRDARIAELESGRAPAATAEPGSATTPAADEESRPGTGQEA
jgi:DivIVA domain-containing protein